VLLAAWQALLGRYAGTGDVVVGSPVAGRDRLEVQGLIGFFVNTLVLRAISRAIRPSPSCWRVRETVLGAQSHADLPFERLVDELGVERSLSHTPLFQAAFSFDDVRGEAGALRLGGVEVEPFSSAAETAKFDLDAARLRRRADLARWPTARRCSTRRRSSGT
jgi:non-ribosomal peptide synthetase component F